MNIDDGYTPNRYAKYKQQARKFSPQPFVNQRTVHFRGKLTHDDIIEEETENQGNKMGRNDDVDYSKQDPLFLSMRQKNLPRPNEKGVDITIQEKQASQDARKRSGNLIDLYA